MSDWLRRDSIRLGTVAYQVGLTPEDADKALVLGARFLAHGFTSAEIDEMIRWQYRQWAEEDRAVRDGTSTVGQTRRWYHRKAREERND